MTVNLFGGKQATLTLCHLAKGAEWRANKLSASEYDETTWSARTFMAFTTQRLSVAVQYSAAQEEGGRGARPVGGGRPTSGALPPRWAAAWGMTLWGSARRG